MWKTMSKGHFTTSEERLERLLTGCRILFWAYDDQENYDLDLAMEQFRATYKSVVNPTEELVQAVEALLQQLPSEEVHRLEDENGTPYWAYSDLASMVKKYRDSAQ